MTNQEYNFVARNEDGTCNVWDADFAIINIDGDPVDIDLPDHVFDAIQTLRKFAIEVMDNKFVENKA